jgi:hypothetical protein
MYLTVFPRALLLILNLTLITASFEVDRLLLSSFTEDDHRAQLSLLQSLWLLEDLWKLLPAHDISQYLFQLGNLC